MEYILVGNRIYTLQLKLCDRTLRKDYEGDFSNTFDARDHHAAMQRAKVKVLAYSRLAGKTQEFGILATLSVVGEKQPFWRAQFLSQKPLTRATWKRFEVKVDSMMIQAATHGSVDFLEFQETD